MKQFSVPSVMTLLVLFTPFDIYGTSFSFDFRAALWGIEWRTVEGGISLRLFPDVEFLFPAMMVCLACFFWLLGATRLPLSKLLGSVILVVVALTGIQALFLPLWAVLPWLFEGYVLAAYVPQFIDLIAFSGLTFSLMVLLPCIYVMFTQHDVSSPSLGVRIAPIILSILAVLSPMTIEIFSWQGTDINRNFYDGFSFTSPAWSMSSRISGNSGGQAYWLNFSSSSVFELIYWGLIIVPGILFAWSVCQLVCRNGKPWTMIPLALVHILILALLSNWINITSSHAGTWIMYPFPSLLIGGLGIAVGYWAYSRRMKGSDNAHDVLASIQSKSK